MGMLVLSRRKNEKILIYDGDELLVTVTVADVQGKKVKLGFTAPEKITIDREEVFERKKKGTS